MDETKKPEPTAQEQSAQEGFDAKQEQAPAQDEAAPMKGMANDDYIKDGRKPINSIIYNCRRSFYFVIISTIIIDTMYLVPMLFMMIVMDKVMNSRSVVTLISVTLVVVGIYLFWSALEWIRTRMMVRLSLRLDWDLSADIFDASFRRFVGRKNINVQQL